MIGKIPDGKLAATHMDAAEHCIKQEDYKKAAAHLLACVNEIAREGEELARMAQAYMERTIKLQDDMIDLLQRHTRLQNMYLTASTWYEPGELWAMENLLGDIDCHWHMN